MFADSFGSWNSGDFRRQSSGVSAATRLVLNDSVRMPACIGL